MQIGESNHRTKGLLRLTMACNERCAFCNVPVEDFRPATPPDHVLEAELAPFLDGQTQTLTISGGEPTLLRKRLLALVRRAREGGVRFVELQTNAILIDAAYAADLAEAGVTSAFVSLLSHDPAHHDALTEVEGSHVRCVRGIRALHDAGIRVTLNPVTTRQTQHLLPAYMDFVGTELAFVRLVSLSAVQPHGRARGHLERLLPDYDVLAEHTRVARGVAEAHGIEVVNPYCGLPLCVGWTDGQSHSVEAAESVGRAQAKAHGIRNDGNKRHQGPCYRCALRTRCGGAWHAYWDHRDGAGLRAVEPHDPPFLAPVVSDHVQTLWCDGPLTSAELPATRDTATLWARATSLQPGIGPVLFASAVTDLALVGDDLAPHAWLPTLKAIAHVSRRNRELPPQQRLRVHVGLSLRNRPTAVQLLGLLRLFERTGAFQVVLLDLRVGAEELGPFLQSQVPGLRVKLGVNTGKQGNRGSRVVR